MYIGGYKNDNRTEGKEYDLQKDRTHTLFHVKYEGGKEIKIEISKGHKIV